MESKFLKLYESLNEEEINEAKMAADTYEEAAEEVFAALDSVKGKDAQAVADLLRTVWADNEQEFYDKLVSGSRD